MMPHKTSKFRVTLIAATLGLSVLAAGCATKPDPSDTAAVQAYEEANDPLEPMNRYFFEVNSFLDEVLLKPFAGWYHVALPDPAEDGVRNFLRNLKSPVILANDLFQGEWSRAGTTVARFFINSTVGVGGFIDVASMMDMKYHEEDFGQTLGRWGVPAGPYLVLPLLGPSTLRDTAALPLETRGNLLSDIENQSVQNSLYILKAVDARSNLLRASSVLDDAALDKYSFTRDAYLQLRRAEVYDGNDPEDGKEPKEPREPSEPKEPQPPKGAAPPAK